MARRPSFLIKTGLAAALITLADVCFFKTGDSLGAALGLFALAWLAVALVTHPALWRDRRARSAALVAAALGLLQIEAFTLLGWMLCCVALAVTALSVRAGDGEDAWRWFQRLAYQGVVGLIGPLLDALVLRRAGARKSPRRIAATLGLLVVPIVGSAIFIVLFAVANPVIADALDRLEILPLDAGRACFWVFILIPVWGVLRPRYLRRPLATIQSKDGGVLPGLGVASVTLSLVVFNLLFAVQNGLDLAFLWSGAPLPGDVSLAEYAHRGAYPLIVTALLAGLFVLVALRPGGESARRPLIRRLVVLWVLQNLLLVASTILRTLDYVEAYSLTGFRIAALTWMVLVGVGLALICWRMLFDRSAAWLINANVLCAGVVLLAASVVDEGAVAAAWNVRHAREVGGRGAELDLCYLASLRASAAVSLAQLERRDLPPAFRDKVTFLRAQATDELVDRQGGWRSWTWRGQRRLDAVRALSADAPAPLPGRRDFCGEIQRPPSPPAAPTRPAPPLTPTPAA